MIRRQGPVWQLYFLFFGGVGWGCNRTTFRVFVLTLVYTIQLSGTLKEYAFNTHNNQVKVFTGVTVIIGSITGLNSFLLTQF